MKRTMILAATAAAVLLGGLSAEAAKGPTPAQEKTLSSCAMCHDLTSAKATKMGPPLFGLVGSKPAIKGVPYSKWDKKALDAFLADPSKVKPDTTMPVSVEDAAERAAVIKALEGLK